MKKIKLAPLKIGFATFLAVGSVNAAVLASYVNGTDNDAAALVNGTTSLDYTASNLTLSNLGTGSNITVTTVGTTGTPGGTEWLYLFRTMTGTQTPTNENTVNSIAFSITATAGNTLNLTSLTFDAAVAKNSDANTGFQFFWQLYASTDNVNFSAVGGVGSSPSLGNGVTILVSDVVPQLIDLTGLAEAPEYYFQLYLGDNASTQTKAGLIQNFNLNGEITAIPEPSSALLCGLGVLALLRRRR